MLPLAGWLNEGLTFLHKKKITKRNRQQLTWHYQLDRRRKQKGVEWFYLVQDRGKWRALLNTATNYFNSRDVPKVMNNIFSHANLEQQTKESAVVDGNSCCVILECLVTSIACIT